MDADAIKATQDFVVEVLKILVSVFVPLIWSFLDNRFGWRARVRRDSEAFQTLSEMAGDHPTDEQIRTLAILKYRAFDVAKRSMKPNRCAGRALAVMTSVNFSIGILGVFDIMNEGKLDLVHRVCTILPLPAFILFVAALLWYYLDITRAIDAIGYEISIDEDEAIRLKSELKAQTKELTETYELLKECYERATLANDASANGDAGSDDSE